MQIRHLFLALVIALGGGSALAFVHDAVVSAAEATALPTGGLLPGVPGAFDVGHPQACEALLRAARPPPAPP